MGVLIGFGDLEGLVCFFEFSIKTVGGSQAVEVQLFKHYLKVFLYIGCLLFLFEF